MLEEKKGYRIIKVGNILKEQEFRHIREEDGYSWLPCIDVQHADESLDHIINALTTKKRSNYGILIEKSSLVYKYGTPCYYDASKGMAFTNAPDSIFFSINTDIVFPQYLIMQLNELHICEQYNWLSARMQGRIPEYKGMFPPNDVLKNLLLNTYIYIPEGDALFSLFEQQRLFNDYREREIRRRIEVAGLSISRNTSLTQGTLIRHGSIVVNKFMADGGFGHLYDATIKFPNHRQRVAMKELFVKEYCERSPLSNEVTVSDAQKSDYERQKNKFRKEFKLLHQLSKQTSYVPYIYDDDVFAENNTLYYIMQFIENGTIWTHSRNKTLDRQERLGIICHAGIALHYAHNLDYLHLDVTPLNIMVDDFNKGKLIDFGNAKHYSIEADALTSTGQVAKTMLFAAPELLHQQASEYLMQTDVYGLAATLYTTMTGCTPEYERYYETDDNYVKNIVAEMNKAGLHKSIIETVEKGMAYHAEGRQSTVLDFLKQLIPSIKNEELIEEILSLTPVVGFNSRNHKVVYERESENVLPNFDSE